MTPSSCVTIAVNLIGYVLRRRGGLQSRSEAKQPSLAVLSAGSSIDPAQVQIYRGRLKVQTN